MDIKARACNVSSYTLIYQVNLNPRDTRKPSFLNVEGFKLLELGFCQKWALTEVTEHRNLQPLFPFLSLSDTEIQVSNTEIAEWVRPETPGSTSTASDQSVPCS